MTALHGGTGPAEARERSRAGLVRPTAGIADGFAQANLMVVPQDLAWDVLGDVRTDVPQDVVCEDGVPVGRPTDLLEVWQDDLVTFLIGCSFTFESALVAEGIRIAHQDAGVNVPMYRTTRRCVPAALGIADLSAPDFGDAVEVPPGHLAVFWACGVTPQAAVMESRPPLAISHAPGHMLITDIPDRTFLIP